MGLLKLVKNKVTAMRRAWNEAEPKISMSTIMELFSGKAYSEISDLGEITYFTCLKTLSESVGKMPVYLMDADKRRITNHATSYLLQVSPNGIQTPTQLFTYLEYCRNHYGNAYAYLYRDKRGNIEKIIPLDCRRVQIWVEEGKEFDSRSYRYFYTDDCTGKSYWFKPEEILHFKSWVTEDNCLAGKSVREILATSFSGVKASSKFLADLHQHGLIANAVVKFTGDLKRESQDLLLNEIERQARDNNRRMITLPMGFDLQKLDLTLADSQFYELKKYSALQVAAAFGIPSFYLNDLEKSSYANAAMQNLQFYTSTLLYILSSYEQELNRKLLTRKEVSAGLNFKFNVSVLLRGDVQQQAEIIQKFVSSGVYSPNDARRWLDMPPVKDGDKYLVNGNMVPIDRAGAAYEQRGGDNVAENNESS
ncbi:MAG: phage portal protein [Selenomonadaceae bacterium]|nr:phage portal protein [Selenomonadaceae bacterium]